MDIVRLADAKAYIAPKHYDMRSLRLQGFDASGADAQSFIGSVCFLAALGFTAWDKLVVKDRIAAALATPTPIAVSGAVAGPNATVGA